MPETTTAINGKRSEDLQLLSLLDAVTADSTVSQRDLSKATGLNLAKVNFLVKKLVEKGLLKLKNVSASPNKIKYLYIVTPGGLAEKSRLTVRFAARTWREYSETMDRLRTSLVRLSESDVRKVVVLGSGEAADMLLQAAKDVNGLAVVALIDPNAAGEKKRGVPIVSSAAEIEFDRAVPCDDSGAFPGDIAARLGISEDKIWLV